MKISNKAIWTMFIIAIAGLFALQSILTYNLYQAKKTDLCEKVQQLLKNSIDKDVAIRLKQSVNKEAVVINAYGNTAEVAEAGIHQQVTFWKGCYFNLDTLDCLFHDELRKAEIDINYSLIYRDSNQVIIAQRGDSMLLQATNVFRSNSMLIVNGQRVQVIADIGLPAIIKKMIVLLTGTLIGFIAIGILIFLLTKDSINQRRINQLKNDFIQTLVHDMKSPLGIIKNSVFILETGQINQSEKEKYARIADKNIDNILEFIDKTLSMAKMETKTFVLKKIEIDIPRFIAEIKDACSVENSKELHIITSCHLKENLFYADGIQLKRAIINLIDNAIKYSGNPVHITIGCETLNNQLVISVKDDGFGISPQNLHTVFNKFERGAAVGRKDGATGFGLGLSFVKAVAVAHGGDVRVFSIENEGSTFIIILPETFQEEEL